MDRDLDFETLAVRSGLRTRVGDTFATTPPITPSTTFAGENIDAVHSALSPDPVGYAYARNANPTVVSLEQSIAKLEGAEDAVAFGSGLAAIYAGFVGLGLESGDVILAGQDLYGGTRSVLAQLTALGLNVRFVDVMDHGAVRDAIQRERPRLLHFESMTNPLLRVPDVEQLVEIAHGSNVRVTIDNTFATPYIYRPIEDGIDLVMHSVSKYLAGHGDVIAGVVAGRMALTQRIRDSRTASGAVLSPFEAWLTMRGLRTLPVRMDRHCQNALEVAGWLETRPWVERVYYPGLPSHPQHALSVRQFGDRGGGMIACDLAADQQQTLRFIDALELITPGTSLGDVESLVLYPPLSSHRQLDQAGLQAAGIGQGLLRLSIGLESARDITADLDNAAREAGLAQGMAQPASVR